MLRTFVASALALFAAACGDGGETKAKQAEIEAAASMNSPAEAARDAANAIETPCTQIFDWTLPFCEWRDDGVEIEFQRYELGDRRLLEQIGPPRGGAYTHVIETELHQMAQQQATTRTVRERTQVNWSGVSRYNRQLEQMYGYQIGRRETVSRTFTVSGDECAQWNFYQRENWRVGVATHVWTNNKTGEERRVSQPIRVMNNLFLSAVPIGCPRAQGIAAAAGPSESSLPQPEAPPETRLPPPAEPEAPSTTAP